MPDVLIRNIPEDELARIDAQADRVGLSRSEYLRRRIAQDASRSAVTVTRADFQQFADLAIDLGDDDAMRGAWE